MNARLLACLWFGALAGAAQSLPVISLADALARARQYAGQIQTANLAVLQAKQDLVQARASRLPTLSALNQFIYTEGNGTPSGVFVANDGVHIYNEQAIVHQDLLAPFRQAGIKRALTAQAIARARVDVAARGLKAVVIQSYYAIAAGERKVSNAETSVTEAGQFVDITEKQEKGGEAAHADVIKAQLGLEQRRRDLAEARLALEKAKIALGVLIFPNFSSNFEVVDDLQKPVPLPSLDEAHAQASASSPEIQAAGLGVKEANYDVSAARYGYVPSFDVDLFYGIDANQFAVRTNYPTQAAGHVTLPSFEVPYRRNLGYVVQATLDIPIWDWGTTRSKVKQAQLRRDQARLDLSLTRRALDSTLAAAYAEAEGSQAQIASFQKSLDLAAQSLRLTLLRYKAGEATALEVVDAQASAAQSRNAYDDGLARYRIAVKTLQTLMGTL